jgi:hypothetical protein
MREQITKENFPYIMGMWKKELHKVRWQSRMLIGKAQTVPLGSLFQGDEFALLCARKIMPKLRSYRRNV